MPVPGSGSVANFSLLTALGVVALTAFQPANTQYGGYEGIDRNRHRNTGIVVFTDGHSEARKDKQINPHRDPGFGDARGLINSRFWDPLRRSNQ